MSRPDSLQVAGKREAAPKEKKARSAVAAMTGGHNQWDLLIVVSVVLGLVVLTWILVDKVPRNAANILGVVAPVLAAVFGISVGATAGAAAGRQAGQRQGKEQAKQEIQGSLDALQATTDSKMSLLRKVASSPKDEEGWQFPANYTVPAGALDVDKDVSKVVGIVSRM